MFITNDAYNEADFPVTSEIKARFKKDEGGTIKMDETLRKWRDEWISEGEERGEKLGSKNEKIKIAGDMKKRGFKDELIAEITGLSKKVIMAL